MSQPSDKTEANRRIEKSANAWRERAQIADKQGQQELSAIAEKLANAYGRMPVGQDEPDVFAKANLLRKRIESTEQHRTMAAEHGLSNEAIDATYEIQALENELIELIRANPID